MRPSLALDYRPALFSRSGIARVTRELARALAPLLAETGSPLQLYAHALRRPLDSAGHPCSARLGQAGHPCSAQLRRLRLPGRLLQALAPLGLDAWRLSGKPQAFLWTDYVYPAISPGRPCKRWLLVHDLAFVEDPRFHGAKASEVLRRRFEKALAQADLLLYPSEATRDALLQHYPGAMRDTHSQLLPFGLDHVPQPGAAEIQAAKAKAARLLGSEEPYLVILGTLEPRKNHDSLLRALGLLAAEGRPIPLLVIGAPGWLSEELQARLRSHGPRLRNSRKNQGLSEELQGGSRGKVLERESPRQNRGLSGEPQGRPRNRPRDIPGGAPGTKGGAPFPLAWTGPLPDAEVFPLLAGAAGLVYPSSLEGFGFPPLEALLLGTPVLAGDCPALRETLAGQRGALFADGRDPVALAAQIPQLMTLGTGPCEQLRSRRWKAAAETLLPLLPKTDE